IVGELGGLSHLSWVVTGYLLGQTIVTPLYGKLGDLYGRKIVLQSAIVLFLIGSVLCGMGQSMTQLILFRFIQGMGGGGLMVTSQAVVGDIVPPRDRGRYQGIFGAVFGVASIAGPLLGGFFTTQMSWRWIFYINIPFGIAAMVVIATSLPRRPERVRHAIDYAGAALLAVGLSSAVLVSDLGGGVYPWGSPQMLALMALFAIAVALFIRVEQRAKEPVLPLRLFGDRTFALSALIGLIVGFALFGSVTYLPLFLQVVKGSTPTSSGLQMIAMMAGMLITSIVSGQLISRSGHYRKYPIIGTLIMTSGLFMVSRVSEATPMVLILGYFMMLGLGLGFVMQVLVVAVQNAVQYRDLGVATSGATLFRLMGGSIGTAVLGAIFAARLTRELSDALTAAGVAAPAGGPGSHGADLSMQALAGLDPAVRAAYTHAFTASLNTVFVVAACIGLVSFILTWMMPEKRLRDTIATSAGDLMHETAEVFPMPVDAEEVQRELEEGEGEGQMPKANFN
ncbi:MAG TPA: MDR family MFS transporter, partial [Longimicrobiales bacterium]